jgi:EAL domain-containing protein (putative c-di-GMP-specific phosphodiesterase class I)/FixJ family two-component response regulator
MTDPLLDISASGVLVVDDDVMQGKIISGLCANLGRLAACATSFEAAADLLATRSFECVTIDLSLGNHDGIELLRLIADLGIIPRVIIISGCEERILNATVRMAHAAGIADAVSLPKPINLATLREMLRVRSNDGLSRLRAFDRSKVVITAGHLQRAMLRREIYPAFQPKIQLSTGRVVGCEALARWDSAELGSIGPDLFIPLAEETGYIKPLTLAMLRNSLDTARDFIRDDPDFVVAVNLSATLLTDPTIPEGIDRLLCDAGMPAKALMIEVTESTAMSDISQAMDILLRLRIKGVGVSMDDFGTGYSSLSALAQMPFCELKIDRSFLKNCLRDPDMWKVVASSVAIAHQYNMKAVAEGIEDDDTRRALEALGCDVGQGFEFSRALPRQAFATWYAGWNRKLAESAASSEPVRKGA